MSERVEREPMDPELAAALRELANDPVWPSPATEARVFAEFDRTWNERPRVVPRRLPPVWIALAASLVAAVGLALFALLPAKAGSHGNRSILWLPPSDLWLPPSGGSSTSVNASPSGFITLPGAVALPPLESGQLVRTDLPVSMLPSLGITPVGAQGRTVKADILVGQDGIARAVRLVNQP